MNTPPFTKSVKHTKYTHKPKKIMNKHIIIFLTYHTHTQTSIHTQICGSKEREMQWGGGGGSKEREKKFKSVVVLLFVKVNL